MKQLLVIVCCCVIGSYSMYAEDNNQIEGSIDMLLSDTRVEDFSNKNLSGSDDSLILVSPSGGDHTIALETITSSISGADNQSELSGEFLGTPLPIDKEYEEDNTSHEQQIDDVSLHNDKIVVSTSSASIVSDTEQRTVVVDNDIVTIIWK